MRIISLNLDNDEEVESYTKALKNKTRRKILELLEEEPLDLIELSERIGQTESNMSKQIIILETLGLVDSIAFPASHGLRKICFLKDDQRIIDKKRELRKIKKKDK